MLPGHLCQMQRVAWCAYQNGRSNFLHSPQALHGIHPPARNSECPKALGPFIGRPETNKWTKAKGQKDDIVTGYARSLVDTCPAIGPPIPAFLRIQYLHGSS